MEVSPKPKLFPSVLCFVKCKQSHMCSFTCSFYKFVLQQPPLSCLLNKVTCTPTSNQLGSIPIQQLAFVLVSSVIPTYLFLQCPRSLIELGAVSKLLNAHTSFFSSSSTPLISLFPVLICSLQLVPVYSHSLLDNLGRFFCLQKSSHYSIIFPGKVGIPMMLSGAGFRQV